MQLVKKKDDEFSPEKERGEKTFWWGVKSEFKEPVRDLILLYVCVCAKDKIEEAKRGLRVFFCPKTSLARN